MRNNVSKLFLLLFILISVSAAWSVISDYSFSSATGTYTEISGGTVHGDAANDNQVFNAVPLGFSLNFNGVVYDQVSIATNGYIAMGPTVINSNTSISSGASNNVAAICNRDIASRTTGQLMSLMSGTAPSRVFTIQWKNYRRYPTQCANDTLNFQIQLYESTNAIKYAYGYFRAVDYNLAQTVQVGLRGAANTEYVNRTTTTDWTATTAGATNSANCRMNALIVPPNGLVFSWTPPQIGTVPFPAEIVSPGVNATGVALSANLNWMSGGGIPTGYRVYMGTDNPPTNIVNGTSVTTTSYDPAADFAYNTQYFWKIIPFNEFGDAVACPVWSFTSMLDPTVTTFPYTQNWDTATVPNVPSSWTVINANADANAWVVVGTGANSAPNAVRCSYNQTLAMDDWLISPPLSLSAETFYRLQFQYKAQSATLNESMEIRMGNTNTVAGLTTQIYNNATINNTTYTLGNVAISPVPAGIYYIGFHGNSAANSFHLYLDDINISTIVPTYDPPVNLTATPTISTITLNWAPTTGSNPSGYKVFRGGVLITPTPITAATYVDSAVEFGTNYTYYVTAVYTNPVGESVASNSVTSTLLEPMLPPSNLAVAVTGYTANVTWSAPGITPVDNWINWDSGTNNDSIGTGAAANFDVAQRFTQTDLLAYQGCNITQIKFWPNEVACTYTIKVWTGGSANPYNAGTMVTSQAVTAPVNNAWNTVTLTTPVPIPATGEVWFGYNVNTTAGYPAGCDAGPAHNGFGNMMYFQNAWTTLVGLAPTLNYDWNISAHVTNVAMQTAVLTPIAQPAPVYNTGTLACSGIKNTSPQAVDNDRDTEPTRDVIGYKVFRNATLISTITDPTVHAYADPNLAPATYAYTVTATYAGGNSNPAGPVSATVVGIFNPPTALAYTTTAASVTLTWALPSPLYGTISGYKVFRNSVLMTATPIPGLTYTDTTVSSPNQYVYYVTAVYSVPVGESAPSSNVTVQFGENLDPPTDLTHTVATDDVTLTWIPPGGPILQDWIHYDDNINFDSIGTGGVSTFEVAARFTQTELTGLHDRHMIRIKFFPNEANCVYNVKIYTGGTSSTNPGTVAMTVPVPTPVIGEWNVVQLPTPLQIPTTNELWLAIECIAQAGYPAGCDDGPSLPYKSNMIKFNGVWDALSVITQPNVLDYNWNIQGFVVNNVGEVAQIAPVRETAASAPVVHNSGSFKASGIINPRYAASRDLDRSMTGYKIYRDGVLIGTITDPLDSDYADMDLANGTYSYTVTATYTGGLESVPVGPVVATINVPQPPTVITDGFESYTNFALAMPYVSITTPGWTLTDVDLSPTATITNTTFPGSGAAMAFMAFNPSATTPPITTMPTHGGAKMAACFAATTPSNNDWMITHRIHIGTQATIKFWAKSLTAQYGLERFKVGISTNPSQAPATFAIISGATHVEAPITWTQYTYNVPASYNNQNISVGIQCVSNDAFIFFVDDVLIQGYNCYVGNDDDTVPVATTELLGNYPNPFNPETLISYNVKTEAPVSIEVYNLKGQKVKSLVNGKAKSGNHSISWNGTDDNGKKVTSGVYFYRMTSGKYTSSRKMILMK